MYATIHWMVLPGSQVDLLQGPTAHIHSKDSSVFVGLLARKAILTDSCQVFVLQLYLCNDSVLIILYYDHCPVPMQLKCSDYFVFIATNEILDIQMSHRQLLYLARHLPTLFVFATCCQQFGGNMFRLLGCYAKLNLQNV